MARYVLSRLAQFAVVLPAALLVVFMALQIVADPARTMMPVGAPAEAVESFRELNGFNRPVLTQAVDFMGGALTADFGESLWLGGDALQEVLARLPATIMLAVPATVFGALLGVAVGAFAARRAGSRLSRALNLGTYALISFAEFWVAIMLVLLVSVQLGWLPTSGYSPKPAALILPLFVLSLRPFARVFQLTRSTMEAEYGKQYVMAARAKGLSEPEVSRRHVLRMSSIPVLTLAFYELSRVFVGTAVVVELIFAWPGIGRLAVGALERGDVFLIQAIVAVAAVATAVINLSADLLYFGLDPRTRSLVKQRHT